MIDFWKWVVFEIRDAAKRNPDDEELVALAEQIGDPDPWQEWYLKHALEMLPDGTFRFKRVLLLVARQNGKTLLMAMVILWRLFQDRALNVIGVAQKEEKAADTWALVVALARAVPDLAVEVKSANTGNGKTVLRLTNRAVYRPQPANKGGGRGFTAELVFFDELQDHTDFSAWSAAANSSRAIPRAQVMACATAGSIRSTVERHIRNLAVRAISGDDLDETEQLAAAGLGLFEWSAPDGCDLTDRDGRPSATVASPPHPSPQHSWTPSGSSAWRCSANTSTRKSPVRSPAACGRTPRSPPTW
ncbi:MAG: hypothetical protein Q4E05_11500 [Pseudoclavibacter sp.]|nr:hypothetical protein [Pseudoclavibacter sp.]